MSGYWRDYFVESSDATLVPFSALRRTRDDPPEKVERARSLLAAGRLGGSRRKPLRVRREPDGTLVILDGNATHAALEGSFDGDVPVVFGL